MEIINILYILKFFVILNNYELLGNFNNFFSTIWLFSMENFPHFIFLDSFFHFHVFSLLSDIKWTISQIQIDSPEKNENVEIYDFTMPQVHHMRAKHQFQYSKHNHKICLYVPAGESVCVYSIIYFLDSF